MRGINSVTWRSLCELAFLNTLAGATKPTRFRLNDEGCAWYLDTSAVAVPIPSPCEFQSQGFRAHEPSASAPHRPDMSVRMKLYPLAPCCRLLPKSSAAQVPFA
jgi:hypothetical protein